MAVRSFVFFHRDGDSYAVDVSCVRRVVRSPQLRRLPAAPGFVMGGSRVEDRLVVMIDPARLFGSAGPTSAPAEAAPPEAATRFARAVLVEVDGRRLGLLADEVEDVAEVDVADLSAPPPFVGGSRRDAVVSVLMRGPREVLVLDLARLLTGAELAEIPVASD